MVAVHELMGLHASPLVREIVLDETIVVVLHMVEFSLKALIS